MPLIAEAQTIIYTCRKIDKASVNLLAFKKDVLDICDKSTRYPNNCRLYTGMHPIIFHSGKIDDPDLYWQCRDDPPLRTGDLNTGWIESPKTAFNYYYEGISPTIAGFLRETGS